MPLICLHTTTFVSCRGSPPLLQNASFVQINVPPRRFPVGKSVEISAGTGKKFLRLPYFTGIGHPLWVLCGPGSYEFFASTSLRLYIGTFLAQTLNRGDGSE